MISGNTAWHPPLTRCRCRSASFSSFLIRSSASCSINQKSEHSCDVPRRNCRTIWFCWKKNKTRKKIELKDIIIATPKKLTCDFPVAWSNTRNGNLASLHQIGNDIRIFLSSLGAEKCLLRDVIHVPVGNGKWLLTLLVPKTSENAADFHSAGEPRYATPTTRTSKDDSCLI